MFYCSAPFLFCFSAVRGSAVCCVHSPVLRCLITIPSPKCAVCVSTRCGHSSSDTVRKRYLCSFVLFRFVWYLLSPIYLLPFSPRCPPCCVSVGVFPVAFSFCPFLHLPSPHRLRHLPKIFQAASSLGVVPCGAAN